MFRYLESMASKAFSAMPNMDRQQWILVFFGALVIGYFCMRGFGSRSNY